MGCMVLLLLGATVGAFRWRVLHLLHKQEELKENVDQALAKIKVLGGLIPICANCKKIRDDSGYWNQLEQYLYEHSEATLTHGICPDCQQKIYGEFFQKATEPPRTAASSSPEKKQP
jgi:hypothetical protein